MEIKICSKCKLEKSLNEFVKHPGTKDGLQCRCNQCRKVDRQEYYKKNKKLINTLSKNYRKENRDKLIEYSKNYYTENRHKLLEEKKEYYKKNSNIIYEKLVLYNIKNKVKINEYRNKYNKEKKQTDPLYKLKTLMRDRLNKYFKYSKLNKNNTTFEIIGCTPLELKIFLEKKFTDGMSWDNQGKWHIDHIIPLSSAKTEEEIYKLCHHSNLQPLWAKDNLRKSNKLDYLYVMNNPNI